MAVFHVYVEGPVDTSPDAITRLAEKISRTYGLPADELVTRLKAGRFRVKANVDRVTANTYGRSLEEVGARVTIEPAETVGSGPSRSSGPARPGSASVAPPSSSRSGAVSLPPPRPASSTSPPALPPPRPTSSSLPPSNAPRPASSSLPAATAARPSSSSLPPANAAKPQQMTSGLSAAFSQELQVPSDLGALGDASYSLSSIDGKEDQAPAATFKAPTAEIAGLPASIGPAALPAPMAAPERAQGFDLFAPPDAEEAELQVNLAPEEVEHRARKMSTPPAGVPTSRPLTPSGGVAVPVRQTRPPATVLGGTAAAETPRVRFAAGVLLSILIGFLPAHVIASAREDSSSATIDAEVVATQNQADSPEMYEALDAFRAAQLSRKRSDRRMIALTSMLIWGLAGAGIAYVWFRRVPWHRFGQA